MATFYQDAVKQIGMTEGVLHSLYKKIGRKDHVLFTEELLENKGGTKKELASFLFKVVNCSLDCIRIMKSGCLEVDALKSEAKCAIKDLAEVQSELLHNKREQINALQASVQTTIKSEMKSYCDIAKKSSGSESVILKKIKTVVQDIVEDRSKNLMIFGLEETAGENLNSKVNEVFQELNEKPMFKADRVGGKASDRPVKVTCESSSVVSDLLRKSKVLKSSVFCSIYLKPDRTLEQRQKHRELVAKLKESIKNSPDKHHFIKNGEVCHEEKKIQEQLTVKAESANGSSGPGATKEKKKSRKKLLPHHIAVNRRPPLGYISPATTDTSDCDG